MAVPTGTGPWDKLRSIGKVRNRFAHAGGEADEEISKIVNTLDGVSVDIGSQIVLDDKFLPATIALIREFSALLELALEAERKARPKST